MKQISWGSYSGGNYSTYKNIMARESGGELELFKYLLTHSNKLTYLQFYGNNSPKSHKQGYLNF